MKITYKKPLPPVNFFCPEKNILTQPCPSRIQQPPLREKGIKKQSLTSLLPITETLSAPCFAEPSSKCLNFPLARKKMSEENSLIKIPLCYLLNEIC